jgi:hypothetical protein
MDDESLKLINPSNFESFRMKQIYFIISEIMNNDLQYGIGIPKWNMAEQYNYLLNQVINSTVKSNFDGKRNQNIESRNEKIKSTYSIKINEVNKISIICKIPIIS